MIFQLLSESLSMAFKELTGNKLRTFLSLAGITIGIFCIISVLTVIDSFENQIRSSFSKLGSDVVYVSRFPWGGGENIDWEKIIKRPKPSLDDYEAIKKNVPGARTVSFAMEVLGKEVKSSSEKILDIEVFGPTHEFDDIWQFDFFEGRYFSPAESHSGSAVAVIGAKIAEDLFGTANPVGESIKIDGRAVNVIGQLAKEGESLIGITFDESIIIPINYLRKFTSTKKLLFDPLLNVAPAKGVSLDQLKSEITIAMRAVRQLRPAEEENFSLNQLSILDGILDQVFKIVNMAAWIIGLFSILVGGFGIANIMFVSVRERTKMIGIKKSLGARRSAILAEFIVEAIMLCILGGLWGLLSVYLMMALIGYVNPDYIFEMNVKNMIIGVGLSIVIGLISGFLPAVRAAYMDPVIAIRSS